MYQIMRFIVVIVFSREEWINNNSNNNNFHFISFIYFHIELNNRYNQISKSVKIGYKGHYNAYMKPTIVQCQFDNTVG